MKKIKSLLRQLFDVYCREFKIVSKDMGMILFFTFLPLAYPIVYSLIYNPELVREVDLIIVDHDRTPMSRKLVRNMDATQEANVIGYAADLNEARRAMDNRDCFGILEIPEGFQRNLGINEQGKAVMYCDMSLLLRYKGLLIASTNVSQELGSQITYNRIDEIVPLATTIATGDPLPIENVALGNTEGGFDSFIMPGVVVLILQQCIILACGLAGGTKRERTVLLGFNPRDMQKSVFMTMTGQMLCYLTVLAVPALFLFHYVPLIFSFPMAGNMFEIMAFMLPMMLASMGLGFMLQGVMRERENVFVIWVATSVVFLFLSGLTWPRYAMSPFWKFLSDLVPGTWGIEGFIKMNANGSTIAQVSDCYINLWILAAVYMAFAYCIQRWIVRPAELKYT